MTRRGRDDDAGSGKLLVVVGLLQESRVATSPGVRVIVGGGRSAEFAGEVEAALAAAPGLTVLSFGVAGALSPGLDVGDVIAPETVSTLADDRFATDAGWTARLRAATGARTGAIVGVDTVVGAPADKARLWEATGAIAVDMESHVAAAAAARHGAPFAALRVISDRADRSLPRAAVAGLKRDGSVDVAGVLLRLIAAPVELPALIRTGVDARRAFRKLAEVRRTAGPTFDSDG